MQVHSQNDGYVMYEPAPVTTSAAVAMTLSYWWLPALKAASEFAGIVVPILGAIWLIVQIVTRVMEFYRRWGNRT